MARSQEGKQRWWVVDDANGSWACYQAPSGRQAVAAYRRDRVAADVAAGVSRRQVSQQISALGLAVVAGPLTATEACNWETEWTLAEAEDRRAVHSSGQRGLTEQDRARIVAAIAARYGSASESELPSAGPIAPP
jgi:hypothetical protein